MIKNRFKIHNGLNMLKVMAYRSAIIFSLLSGISCTFEDGKPWGYWQPNLWMVWSYGDRIDPQTQRFNTAKSYALDDLKFSFQVDQIKLYTAAIDQGGANGFDPSKPPAGCTLCHNDHCHCGNELVPYAQLAAQSNQTSSSEQQIPIAQNISFDIQPMQTQIIKSFISDCDPSTCALDRTRVTSIAVSISHLKISAKAYDLIPNAQRSIPNEGEIFSLDFPISLQLGLPLDEVLDEGKAYDLPLQLIWQMPPSLFDLIDWQQMKAGLSDEDQQAFLEELQAHLLLKSKIHVIKAKNIQTTQIETLLETLIEE
jgi:hypothetical protein